MMREWILRGTRVILAGAAVAVGACTAEAPLTPSPPAVVAPTETAYSESGIDQVAAGSFLGESSADTPMRTVRIPADGDAREAIELPSIDVGETIRLTSDCATRATWRSSAPRVATVDSGGLVTGRGAGRARITETCAGVDSSVFIRVRSVRYTFAPNPPTPATVRVGASGHFRANLHRGGGRVRLKTGVASTSRNVLRLQLEGDRWRWTAAGAGRAEIRVTHNGRRVLTHAVTVTRPPGGGGGGGGGGGSGEAAEIRDLSCRASGSLVTISGAVHAFRPLRSVTVRAFVDDRPLGTQSLGDFRARQTKRFSISGTDPFLNSNSRCSVRLTGREAAAQLTRELATPGRSAVMQQLPSR